MLYGSRAVYNLDGDSLCVFVYNCFTCVQLPGFSVEVFALTIGEMEFESVDVADMILRCREVCSCQCCYSVILYY